MADRTGLEPATSGVTGRHSNQLNYRSKVGCGKPHVEIPNRRLCNAWCSGGWYRDRTCDLQLVRLPLSQLS